MAAAPHLLGQPTAALAQNLGRGTAFTRARTHRLEPSYLDFLSPGSWASERLQSAPQRKCDSDPPRPEPRTARAGEATCFAHPAAALRSRRFDRGVSTAAFRPRRFDRGVSTPRARARVLQAPAESRTQGGQARGVCI